MSTAQIRKLNAILDAIAVRRSRLLEELAKTIAESADEYQEHYDDYLESKQFKKDMAEEKELLTKISSFNRQFKKTSINKV